VVLDELLQHQRAPTTVCEDNDACRMVADSTAPNRQMRHIAINDFRLQDCTEINVIALTAYASNVNASDVFTKQSYGAQQIINIAYALIFNTGVYGDACKEWEKQYILEKIWDNFKAHFTTEH
jgi:hypothetical protein